MARLLAPTLGTLASSKSFALCRSANVRKPALAKARAVPSDSPMRSQALDACEYSSKDAVLCLSYTLISPILSEKSRHLEFTNAVSFGGECAQWRRKQEFGHLVCRYLEVQNR